MPPYDLPDEIRAIAGNEQNLHGLIEQLKAPKRLIPFVGAGMSAPYKFPTWAAFLELLGKDAGVLPEIQHLLAIDQYESTPACPSLPQV